MLWIAKRVLVAKGKRGRGPPRKRKVEDEVVNLNKQEKKPGRPPKVTTALEFD